MAKVGSGHAKPILKVVCVMRKDIARRLDEDRGKLTVSRTIRPYVEPLV